MKEAAKKPPWLLVAFSITVATAIFVIDITLPLGVAGGVPYVALVLLGWWFPNRNAVVVLAIVSTVLTSVGFQLSPEGGIHWVVEVNRFLALFAIWTLAIFIFVAKTAADDLRDSEQRFRSVIDNAPSFITLKDVDGRIVLSNQKHSDMFGMKPRDMKGKTVFDFLPEKTAKEATAQDQDVLETKSATIMERKTLGERGPLTYHITKFPIPDRTGAISGIGTIGTDITEHKKMEESLRESESRFRSVVDSSPAAITLKDRDGRFILVNKTYGEWMNADPSEIAGLKIRDLLPKQQGNEIDALDRRVIETGESAVAEGDRPFRDGVTRTVLTHKCPIFSDTGEVISVVSVITDISDRKRAENEIKLAMKEAERANNAKSEFLSSMSHELRTPLNAILGFTQLLNTDTDHPLTEKQLDATEQVLKSGDHLLSLIDEVLDLAAIESGKVSLDMEAQDPTPVIESCTAIARNLAEQKGLEFYDRTAGWRLPEINIDATRFRQVLLNLLSNAVKYNRDGGTVTLFFADGEDGTVRFSVADSGRGIAEDKHAQIFSPFSRLGLENSDITGTGIGLTITRELVEAMGGTIGFESTLNLGSTFWLEFPIVSGALSVKDRGEEPAPAPAATTAAADTPPQATHTVLCVEDNPSSLKLLESIIERIQGTAMISAHTGELGVDLAEIHQPDVILMDINLPGINGIEALYRLKASSATKDIPVIALTARASKKDKAQGLKAGFLDYLTKPINVREVTSALNQAFQGA